MHRDRVGIVGIIDLRKAIMKMKLVMSALVLLFSTQLVAGEAEKQEKLKALVSVMDMDAMVDTMYDQVEAMMQNVSVQMGVKPSEQPIFEKHHAKITGLLKSEMSWEKMEPMVIDIYSRNFTEQQIDDLLAFYQTETGQALIKKMPTVMQESMLIGQSMMQQSIPKIQAMAQELAQELQQARAQP